MAWPLTRYRTLINGSTFWDDLFGNALQDGVNGLCLGTYSHNVLVVDGAGGAAFAAPTADTPLARFFDRTGKLRGGHDHIGYALGFRIFDLREDWSNGLQANITASTNPIDFKAWQFDAAGTAFTAAFLAASASAGYPVHTLAASSPAVGNHGGVSSRNQLAQLNNDSILVWEGEVSLSSASTAFQTFTMGLGSTRTPLHGDASYKAIFSLSNGGGGAAIDARASAGGADSVANTQVINASQTYKLRIEVAGSATFWGAVVRFFIDGTLFGSVNVNLTGQPLYVIASYATNEGTYGNVTVTTGPVRLVFNRFANPPGL